MISTLLQLAPLALLTPPVTAEYVALIPGAIVALVAVIVLLVDTMHRPGSPRDYLGYISAIGLGVAMASCWALWDDTITSAVFHGMIYIDRFSLFIAALSCASGLIAVLMAPAYIRSHGMDRGELYMLVLFSVAGMIFMANAADLLTLFIGLEVMSIPVYCLAGYLRRDGRSAEAAMKYFILGAFSTGLLLYGIAWIYGLTGTTNLEIIGQTMGPLLSEAHPESATMWMSMVAVMLVLSGFAFKIAAVPFHLWTPDVYTGSPTPVVGFMATGVKAAAFAGMIRVFESAFYAPQLTGGFFGYGWIDILLFLAAASIILGNLVAIAQDNVKRMLAYSSIAHAGYILVGFVAASSRPEFFLYHDTVLFYLLSYTFGTLGAFGVLSYFGRHNEKAETYDDLAGLGFKYPFAGLVMAICMFSSAGIPPTAGFVGKLYVFRAAVDVGIQTNESAFIAISVLAVLFSVAGVYYYLRVLVAMYMKTATRERRALEHPASTAALAICAALTLYLGVFPRIGVELAREAVADFQGAQPATRVVQAAGRKQLDAMRKKLAAPPATQVEAPKANTPKVGDKPATN